MKAKNITITIVFFVMISALFTCHREPGPSLLSEQSDEQIFPDYSNITLPVNIAPLNFIINSPAKKYKIEFVGENYSFTMKSKSSAVVIPVKKWKRLLRENMGSSYKMIVSSLQKDGSWKTLNPIVNKISKREIEPYITYRRMNTGLVFWDKMDIVQHSLEDGSEVNLISNQNTEKNCIHCHTLQNRDPQSLLLHLRKAPGGTLIKYPGKTLWLQTKTPYTLSSFVYPSWHPSKPVMAFSTNRIHQSFFGLGHRLNHVRDEASDIVVYDISENMVYTDPVIASYDNENLPTWSPDGEYLYYIRTKYEYKNMADSLELYDLLRIPVNTTEHSFGDPELLISTESIQRSISWPQISPDGKYLVFCMADYGYFTINDPSSDLYMMDLSNLTYKKLAVNSEMAESFPSWSGNNRWLMFTSKRLDGRFTLPFFSYVDSAGNAHKPFVLPMNDPREFLTRITNTNRPVFVSGKIEFTQNELLEIINSETSNVIFDSVNVDIDAIAGATAIDTSMQQTGAPYMRD